MRGTRIAPQPRPRRRSVANRFRPPSIPVAAAAAAILACFASSAWPQDARAAAPSGGRLTLEAPRQPVLVGEPATLVARLSLQGAGAAGRRITLRAPTGEEVASSVTGADGAAELTFRPPRNGNYVAQADLLRADSSDPPQAAARLRVRPRIAVTARRSGMAGRRVPIVVTASKEAQGEELALNVRNRRRGLLRRHFESPKSGRRVFHVRLGGGSHRVRLSHAASASFARARSASAKVTGLVRRSHVLGRSLGGREIRATEIGNPSSSGNVLVVGAIHGLEPAGMAVTSRLIGLYPPTDSHLWVVPTTNPDGLAARTRGNARGVDLNRNMPWNWRRTGEPFSWEYSGSGPLSEPEARIAQRLIRRLRPKVTIWYHQDLNVVDLSDGDPAIPRRYARLVGLGIDRLRRHPGSVAHWSNASLPGTTAFVVELAAGRLTAAQAARHERAVLSVAAG